MAGGRRSLGCSGSSRWLTAAGQAGRGSEEERDEVDAALWEARLAATEASRAEYREATRWLARSNAELLWRQRDAEREAAAVTAFLAKQGQEKAEEVCAQPGRALTAPASRYSFHPTAGPGPPLCLGARTPRGGPGGCEAAVRPGGGKALRGLGCEGGSLPRAPSLPGTCSQVRFCSPSVQGREQNTGRSPGEGAPKWSGASAHDVQGEAEALVQLEKKDKPRGNPLFLDTWRRL